MPAACAMEGLGQRNTTQRVWLIRRSENGRKILPDNFCRAKGTSLDSKLFWEPRKPI